MSYMPSSSVQLGRWPVRHVRFAMHIPMLNNTRDMHASVCKWVVGRLACRFGYIACGSDTTMTTTLDGHRFPDLMMAENGMSIIK